MSAYGLGKFLRMGNSHEGRLTTNYEEHEDVARKLDYYHFIFHQQGMKPYIKNEEKVSTIVMGHINRIFF